MTRVVLDTNVFISALEFGGIPQDVLLLGSAGFFEIVISEAILDDLVQVLHGISGTTRIDAHSYTRKSSDRVVSSSPSRLSMKPRIPMTITSWSAHSRRMHPSS